MNDTYGHYVGDIVLKGIAKISKKQIKDIGFVGRYGGEGFLILLPKLDLENAKKIAELIRETVEKSEYEIKDGIHGKVTVSLGV
ncbi:GGDEF domain-containing protein [Clostridium saccharoperbutylacetonicum]|uniref:GGDEF domain-containing protein n=1 Tax=Clostridium saccharoperbutylacetonicum TaxID=36745 RepID=UPI0039E75176